MTFYDNLKETCSYYEPTLLFAGAVAAAVAVTAAALVIFDLPFHNQRRASKAVTAKPLEPAEPRIRLADIFDYKGIEEKFELKDPTKITPDLDNLKAKENIDIGSLID